MLILGVTETVQFVDGARQLPVMRYIETCDEVVALAAPALAGAADAALAALPSGGSNPMLNRALSLLRKSAERRTGGLRRSVPEPTYQLLPFSGPAIDLFVRIRAAMSDKMDIFDSQTFAIAMAEDAEILLVDTDRNRSLIDAMHRAGLDMAVRWIDRGSDANRHATGS